MERAADDGFDLKAFLAKVGTGKTILKLEKNQHGDGQWDIPKLRLLLGKILPEQGAMEDYEVEHDFPSIGQPTVLLNARRIFSEQDSHSYSALKTLPKNANWKKKKMI